MLTVRRETENDKPCVKDLWLERFGHENGYADYFFEKRFLPEFGACACCDGEVLSAMQGLPVTVSIRGRLVPAVILSGVSTALKAQGKGLMTAVFRFWMNDMASRGIGVVIHRPARTDSYFSKGHFPVYDVLRRRPRFTEGIDAAKNGDFSQTGELYDCCRSFSYSGTVQRSFADFMMKTEEFKRTGLSLICAREKGKLTGYCVHSEGETEETVYLNESALSSIENALCVYEHACIKLPSQSGTPYGVAGFADMSLTLNALLSMPEYTAKVNDCVVDKNNGVFSLDGERSDKAPMFSIAAGRLLQAVYGYKTLSQLRDEGHITVTDERAFRELDFRLSPCECFCLDEY